MVLNLGADNCLIVRESIYLDVYKQHSITHMISPPSRKGPLLYAFSPLRTYSNAKIPRILTLVGTGSRPIQFTESRCHT